ncbi:MAG: diguanylate cyclase domain-containing protein [Roseburia sp.]
MNITNLEMAQATIEMFGGFICLMLAVIIRMNGHERNSWKMLKWMFIATAGIFFSEACAYIFRGNTDKFSLFMTRSSNFSVFFLDIVLVGCSIYCMYYLLEEKDVVPSKIYKNIVRICVIASFLILVTNLFTKWMYYFDEANYYHRNTGWYVYTVLDLICILTSTVMCIRYRKAVKKTMLAALLLYTFMPVIAIILQAFIYGISITNIGIFIALFLMLLAYLKEWSRTKEKKERERKTFDIVILFIIMTISMSASMISCIVSIEHISNKNSENNSMLIAHMVSDSIENEFLKPIVVAETMSNDYSLKEYMKKSGEDSPHAVEDEVAAYLDSIKTGFGYQMVFVICDESKAYYTYDGISKYIDIENDEHDIWYRHFLEEGKHYDLEVDTDELNQWELSVFVNTEITDENGDFLGVCGVGVKMTELQRLLKTYEDEYDVKINLIDQEGLIQVDTDGKRIEQEYIDNSYLKNVKSDEFYYEKGPQTSRMTKYMEDLGWYLVVEDCDPDKMNVAELTALSIIIFLIGLVMMGIVFFIMSIRERKASKELMERRKISITDDMTGLFNRRAYEEDCMKIQENNLVPKITMIMMDVNGLKAINDTYGHMAGDELIIGASKCIQTSLGKHGKVYRTGGDEFVVLLECTKSQLNDMLQTFEHITGSWKGTYQCELSISKGIVVAKEHEDLTFDEMKELADKLMYEDKDEYYRRTGKVRRKI